METPTDIRKFGRYEILDILGRGSMSTVFRARDPLLNREVAIKAIHHQLSTLPEFTKRFEREVRTLAGINHPNIIDILDMGLEGEIYYMVLKLVSGGTLKERMQTFKGKNQLMPLQDVENILSAVCNALEYIHNHGIVHRDLKPANVMFDEKDRPLLADFGLVKITGGDSYTITRGVIGTPLYMSPEQCKQNKIDRRCDIYSMGAMLYEMTTGEYMFPSGRLGDILIAHLQKQPSSPHAINPALPNSVADVILKAVEKHPDNRYQTARELADAFSAALGDIGEEHLNPKSEQYIYLRSIHSGNKYQLSEAVDNRIGRSKPGKLVEVDLSSEKGFEYIHSLHAIIRHSATGWELEPALGIQNPVYVNGHEILSGSKTTLVNGDHVRLSEMELIIET